MLTTLPFIASALALPSRTATTVAIDDVSPLWLAVEGAHCARQGIAPDPTHTFDIEASSPHTGLVEIRWALHDALQSIERPFSGYGSSWSASP